MSVTTNEPISPTEDTPPAPGPTKRTWRTVVQAVTGFVGGVAIAIGPLGLPPEVSAKVAGICATIVALGALALNSWDRAHGKG